MVLPEKFHPVARQAYLTELVPALSEQPNRPKQSIASPQHFASLALLFVGPFWPVEEENGLQFRVYVDAGGQNNIEINPVFRGMP